MPVVHGDERLLVKHLEFPGFYRAVARYGYVDRVDQGPAFIAALLQQLELEQRVLIASKTKVCAGAWLHPESFLLSSPPPKGPTLECSAFDMRLLVLH